LVTIDGNPRPMIDLYDPKIYGRRGPHSAA
jgi:hypothetical protein